ncbi:MAG: 3-phosphoshikimate 1-carboxyvinyltransferase [Wenzhouxiangella sp.]|nr:MAG: 3-phosphoshikimate 1-carboxyvinyltransferase [Wenzhouxiangella sp.]
MKLRVTPISRPLTGRYLPPGDKSISHRLAILGGLAQGETRISGFLDAADTRATLTAMAELGAAVEESDGLICIRGGRLKAPAAALDLGNSGTGMRLLCGALCGHPDLVGQELSLVGDESLSGRPMARITRPLGEMGARIRTVDGHAPLGLQPTKLRGIRYVMPVASAQVKSAVLLAGLFADGDTAVIEPGPSRDHSERLFPAFGVELFDAAPGIGVRGGQQLEGGRFHVPGDLSSAAFVIAAGLLAAAEQGIELANVGINPTRDGVLRILRAMGGKLTLSQAEPIGNEPVGSIKVQPSALTGIDIPAEWVPLAIDEFPVIMALAAVASGTTRIQGAAELRVKESDRLAVMSEQLRRLGVRLEETPDGAVVEGGSVRGGQVDSAGDHRIAMSLAVLGLVADGPVEIDHAEWIRTSYPGFVDDMRSLGANLEWLD